MLLASLACTAVRVTPQPTAPVEQLQFEIQTATPTVGFFSDAPGGTVAPTVSGTPPLTASVTITATTALTATGTIEATTEP